MKPIRTVIVDGIPVPQAGQHINFYNGEYETQDKAEIAFLKKHQLYGVSITEAPETKGA
jgi:hypothetical protein